MNKLIHASAAASIVLGLLVIPAMQIQGMPNEGLTDSKIKTPIARIKDPICRLFPILPVC